MHDLLSFVDGSPYLFLGIPASTFLTRGVVKLFFFIADSVKPYRDFPLVKSPEFGTSSVTKSWKTT